MDFGYKEIETNETNEMKYPRKLRIGDLMDCSEVSGLGVGDEEMVDKMNKRFAKEWRRLPEEERTKENLCLLRQVFRSFSFIKDRVLLNLVLELDDQNRLARVQFFKVVWMVYFFLRIPYKHDMDSILTVVYEIINLFSPQPRIVYDERMTREWDLTMKEELAIQGVPSTDYCRLSFHVDRESCLKLKPRIVPGVEPNVVWEPYSDSIYTFDHSFVLRVTSICLMKTDDKFVKLAELTGIYNPIEAMVFFRLVDMCLVERECLWHVWSHIIQCDVPDEDTSIGAVRLR